MKRFLGIILSVLISSGGFLAIGAPQAGQGHQEEKVVIGTNEIMVDVVVRDKKGRPVTGLPASAFQISEDGVPQETASFREIMREAPGQPAAIAAKPAAPGKPAVENKANPEYDPFAGVSVVALVFDRLTPQSRTTTERAAESYVGSALKPDDLTGVFSIGLALQTVQPYTNDPELLRKGIAKAIAQSSSDFVDNSQKIRDMVGQQQNLDQQSATAQAATASAGRGNSGAAAGAAAGAAGAEAALLQMALVAEQSFQTLERDQQGYATTYALLSVITSLMNVPGRKAVIFFSEGMSIPPAVQESFRSVINAANHANVSVYPIDAAGLRAASTYSNSAEELKALASQRVRQVRTGLDDKSGRPMSDVLERNEDVLRLDPHSGLGQLAEQTGGFLVSDTNNLANGLRQIDEDMRSHYELTYVPKNTNYDGKFRTIAVKVDRPSVEIQTRKGYFALDTFAAGPVMDYEAPALAAMEKTARPAQFQFDARGFDFPGEKGTGVTSILAEVPGSAVSYPPEQSKNEFKSDFSIVVLIKDDSGKVARKISQHYVLKVADSAAAAKGTVLFYREVNLAPGKYTLEAAAYDAPSGKISVESSPVDVLSKQTDRLALSSITVLARAEQLNAKDNQQINNPFHFGELLVYPNLGQPFPKSSAKQLAFYFIVYTAKGSTTAPKMKLQVLHNGASVAQAAPVLPPPDASGRIQNVSAIPSEGLKPDAYELRITVSDGKDIATRSVPFRIAP